MTKQIARKLFHSSRITAALAFALLAALAIPSPLRAQDGKEADPSVALATALTAACKQNDTQFAIYLTVDNAASFKNLPADQRETVLHRLALVDGPGKPLLSSDAEGHTILHCESAAAAAELRFGAVRAHENLAFIPVRSGANGAGDPTEFGLVREAGGWRIISVGILLFDVSQLALRWEEQDIENHEIKAANALVDLADAIERYREAFGRFPEGLAELGPAPPNQVSPEQANLVEIDLARGTRDSYRFQYRVISDNDGNPSGFELTATPEPYAKSGKRSFLLDSEKVLHGADKRGDMATTDDPVISPKSEK
jgi:hypothetical protein